LRAHFVEGDDVLDAQQPVADVRRPGGDRSVVDIADEVMPAWRGPGRRGEQTRALERLQRRRIAVDDCPLHVGRLFGGRDASTRRLTGRWRQRRRTPAAASSGGWPMRTKPCEVRSGVGHALSKRNGLVLESS
jgi:hypothetical protein